MPAFVSLHLVLPRQEGVKAAARIARPRPRPPERPPLRRTENRLHRVAEIKLSYVGVRTAAFRKTGVVDSSRLAESFTHQTERDLSVDNSRQNQINLAQCRYSRS